MRIKIIQLALGLGISSAVFCQDLRHIEVMSSYSPISLAFGSANEGAYSLKGQYNINKYLSFGGGYLSQYDAKSLDKVTFNNNIVSGFLKGTAFKKRTFSVGASAIVSYLQAKYTLDMMDLDNISKANIVNTYGEFSGITAGLGVNIDYNITRSLGLFVSMDYYDIFQASRDQIKRITQAEYTLEISMEGANHLNNINATTHDFIPLYVTIGISLKLIPFKNDR